MASDKALSNAALELTQKIQLHFPRDISPEILQAWNGCPKELITERALEAFGKMPKISQLLKRVDSITVTLDPGTFVASGHFKVDTGRKAEAKISYLGDNFREWMLGLKVQPPDEDYLYCHELLKNSVDGPIIEELGGEQKAETTLSEIFALMKKQRNGEKGILLTNGYANIFYVRDINGVLRAVDVCWDDDGWDVDARSVEDPFRWGAGRHVFSRNSL